VEYIFAIEDELDDDLLDLEWEDEKWELLELLDFEDGEPVAIRGTYIA
jgi:hypothetical protein